MIAGQGFFPLRDRASAVTTWRVIMKTMETGCHIQAEAEHEAFLRGLVAKAAQIRVPELFTNKPANALYYVSNRSGVSVVALRTADLSREQLIKILTYRLAQ